MLIDRVKDEKSVSPSLPNHTKLLLVVAAWAVSGCGTTTMYRGPRRPLSEVALIDTQSATSIEVIDGKRVNAGPFAKFEMLPGEHIFRIRGNASKFRVIYTEHFFSPAMPACFFARAGHRYTVQLPLEEGDIWRIRVYDVEGNRSVKTQCLASKPRVAAAPTQTPQPTDEKSNDARSGDGDQVVPESRTQAADSVAKGSGLIDADPVAVDGAGSNPVVPPAPPLGRPQGPSGRSGDAENETTDPQTPRPGTGLHLALGYYVGGDDLLSVGFTNGDTKTLAAGTGWFGALGGTVTPLWIKDKVGLGAGASIGWKVDSVDASNGEITLSRFPFLFWLQSLIPMSEKWFVMVAAGAQKDLNPHLSGDGFASGIEATMQSPLGWSGELGLYFAETWHTAVGFGLRYTTARYKAAGASIDASHIGFNLTLHWNP